MADIMTISAACLGEDEWLDIVALARACDTTREFIETLMAEDLLAPARPEPPGFGSAEIARVRRIQRLQRDFEAGLASVSVMLDLLDEIERLRARLHRAGLDAD